jgi:outer membrane protein, heavy metal efflux system
MSRGLCAIVVALTIQPVTAGALPLDEAERLAFGRQPLLEAQHAEVRAGRERAVAARQLPDPTLIAGVTNLPVSGDERYSLSQDFMTMTGVGLMQEIPNAGKRRLRGRVEALMADAGEAKLAALERGVRRDAALAWLALWSAERAQALTAGLLSEAGRERAAADIDFRAGRASQAAVLAADVQLEVLRDRLLQLEQDAAEAREWLARWIGQPVTAPLPEHTPVLPAPPELEQLLDALVYHPELIEADREIAAAGNALALSKQDYWPDWRVEAMYGRRPDFPDMVTLQVGVDLPLFTGRRQDRAVAAASESLNAVTAMHHDHARRLRAEAAAAHRAWSAATQRLIRYDDVIVPRARARAEATLSAYRTGRSDLTAVLDARRGALDIALMRLELQVQVLRRQIELRYLNATGA